MASFDLIRNTATELQELLSRRGDITSTRLVKETLAQIDAHNHHGLKLRAVGQPFGLGVVAQAGREDLLIGHRKNRLSNTRTHMKISITSL
jgi:Asp-tRNA(Asn)/Glu-tRNA(Gln) amidotransferase A subunit family amidase